MAPDGELAGDGGHRAPRGLVEPLRFASAGPHSRNAQLRVIFNGSTFAASSSSVRTLPSPRSVVSDVHAPLAARL
ncbi:MAG: hypothetical protein ACLFU0_09275 [Alphaproteobacteria bacterium]